MKDNRTAIIWRKSVYENDYKCKCGKVLYDHGKLLNMLVDRETNILYCPVCMWSVAKVTTEDKAYKLMAVRCEQ